MQHLWIVPLSVIVSISAAATREIPDLRAELPQGTPVAVVPKLIHVLADKAVLPELKNAAAKRLGELETPEAQRALKEYVSSPAEDPSTEVQAKHIAAVAYWKVVSKQKKPVERKALLLELLGEEPPQPFSSEVVRFAVDELAEIRDPAVLPKLIAAINKQSSPSPYENGMYPMWRWLVEKKVALLGARRPRIDAYVEALYLQEEDTSAGIMLAHWAVERLLGLTFPRADQVLAQFARELQEEVDPETKELIGVTARGWRQNDLYSFYHQIIKGLRQNGYTDSKFNDEGLHPQDYFAGPFWGPA